MCPDAAVCSASGAECCAVTPVLRFASSSAPSFTAPLVLVNGITSGLFTNALLPSQFGVVPTAGAEVLNWDGIQVTGPGSNTPATLSLTTTLSTLASTVTSDSPVPEITPGFNPHFFIDVPDACHRKLDPEEDEVKQEEESAKRLHDYRDPVQCLTSEFVRDYLVQHFFPDKVNTNPNAGEFKHDPGLILPGRKLLLDFRASYNSADAYTGPLGIGWTHTYNILLIPNGGDAVVKEGDGQEIPFIGSGGPAPSRQGFPAC